MMDTRNGQLYQSMEEARAAGVPQSALVGIIGTETQAIEVSKLIAEARARRQNAKPQPAKKCTSASMG